MPHASTVLARFPIFALERAEQLGLDREEIMRGANLDPSELRDPDSRISQRKIMAIWRQILKAFPEPNLGVRLGAQLQVRDVGLVGYLMLHSATLGVALERLTRFGRILDDAYPFSLEIRGDRVIYSVEALAEERLLLHRVADLNVAAFVAVVREITQMEIDPVEIHLPYPGPPSDLSAHRAYFRCELKFDREASGIVLRQQHLALPVVAADEQLGRYLESYAEEAIHTLAPEGGFTERVERALWAGMKEGELSMGPVASSMAMSPRTLQRRLREKGTSFAKLRDSMRREMAVTLLEKRDLAVYEVALLLGYSEPNTFYRAFRRWNGSSPLQYRAQQVS